MKTNVLVARGILCAVLLVFSSGGVANELYRYRNAEGVLVIDFAVPPEFAAGGYEILNSSGQVVEVVAAQKSAEEDVAGEDRAPQLSAEEVQARSRGDLHLTTSYSAPEEIVAARDRKLTQLERDIEIVEANLVDTNRQRIREQERAANLQRAGQAIPPSVTDNLAKMAGQIEQGQQLLAQRRQEYADTKALYDGYEIRFRELKGLPGPVSVDVATEQGPQQSSEQHPRQEPGSKESIDANPAGEGSEAPVAALSAKLPAKLPTKPANEKTPPSTAPTVPPTAPLAGD